MIRLLGDHHVKLDNKGRLLFPSKLRKPLEEVIHAGLVINRDIYESCLVIYPQPAWEIISADLQKMNRYSKKHLDFVRYFLNGATELELDTVGRINIPFHLLEYAGVDLKKNNEVVLCGVDQRIELWSKEAHAAKFLSGNKKELDMEQMAEDFQNDINALGRST